MRNFFITIDSTAAVTDEMLAHTGVSTIRFDVKAGNFSCPDGILSYENAKELMHRALTEGYAINAPSAARYEEFFDDLAEKNRNIIHISCGAGFSDAYNNAVKASRNTMVKFKRVSIYVVDSHSPCAGQALLMDRALAMCENNASAEEAFVELSEGAARLEQYAVSTATHGIFVLTGVDNAGNGYNIRRYTSFNAACRTIADAYCQNADGAPLYIFGSTEIQNMTKAVARLRKSGCTDIRISSMSIAGCLKAGPEAICVAFFGKPRKSQKKSFYRPGKDSDFFTPDEE